MEGYILVAGTQLDEEAHHVGTVEPQLVVEAVRADKVHHHTRHQLRTDELVQRKDVKIPLGRTRQEPSHWIRLHKLIDPRGLKVFGEGD